MTLTLTFAWWWLGAAGLLIGVPVAVLSPGERSSFMGWPCAYPGLGNIIGIALTILSILYLGFGALARWLP